MNKLIILGGLLLAVTAQAVVPLFLTPRTNAVAILVGGTLQSNGTNYDAATITPDNLYPTRTPVEKIAFTRSNTGQASGSDYFGSQNRRSGTNTYRMQHYCTTTCNGLRLMFGNSAAGLQNTNPITVNASVETSDGQIYPVFFAGQKIVTVPPGTFVYSDLVPLMVTNGDYIWSRTCAGSTNPGTYIVGEVTQFSGEGNSPGDLTGGGTMANTAADFAYVPQAIYGFVDPRKSSVLIIGDSIAAGYTISDPYDSGAVTGLGPNLGMNYSHANLALATDNNGYWLVHTNTMYRLQLAKGCNVVLCELGINSLGYPLTTNWAAALWQSYKQLGFKVYQTTLTPYTTGTFTTAAGQTTTAGEAYRNAFNAVVRAGGYGILDGYCDAEAAVSTNSNGNIVWLPNLINDGLYPKNAAVQNQLWTCLTNMTKDLIK